jgi:NTP pyrophosphatase (non-canonical NTP hydrolase)
MAAGRTEGRVVREYLEALRSNKPKRGRKRTPESITARLAAITAELTEADPIRELELVQERMNLETELGSLGTQVDMSDIESEFVKVAQGYSSRKGISYAAWRAVGVEPSVLKKAGISRSS